ncbi:hypothetical protein DPMN_074046 [Dreissena polymorpha]|uniref:RNB domain-containing protein n=1 Tax=Dreissena polymorpha TaxID=45954 RepID=A0A9D4BMY5_DREPO|nr:hypothetical protein DPMN_074046 [Dreissena polymorpha]
MYKGDKRPFCLEEEQWVKKGLDLHQHFVNQFSPKAKFDKIYEQCENATQLHDYLDSDSQTYIRCIIQHDGCHEAKCMPVSKIEGCSVIHISGRSKIGRTFNGDEVVVELIDKNNTSDNKTGKVIGVLKRNRFADINHPVFVCTVDDTGSYLLRPMCKTVPKIKIQTNKIQADGNNATFTLYDYDMRKRVLRKAKDFHVTPKESKFVYLVVMITWNERFPYPLGAIIKILPWGNTITNGIRILNMQFDVPSVYSKKVVKQMKRLETLEGFDEPGLQKQQNRRNCAHLDAFTIDPPNAKDLDDALSLELVEGGYRVGVHISDVSEYVTKDSPCDIEAKERSCTFHPEIKRARHMLPEPLSVQKCSLLAGKIRLAVSVFYIFGSNGQLKTFNLISYEIAKTIIQSRRQFTYKEAQNILSRDLSDCDVDKIENDMTILRHNCAKNA